MPDNPHEAQQKTILLVEDEAILSHSEALTIRGFGYRVITALTGEKAVDRAVNDPRVGLVLMDINLGRGMDGTEAARRIMARRNIPIVFLTSHSEREMVERVRGITRFGYVIKDSGDFVLQSAIEMAFDLFDAHQKTSEGEEALALTLAAIGDGVIATDTTGAITRMNNAAERLTGWTFAESQGRSLSDILHLMTPGQREAAGDPVETALRDGPVAGPANPVVLIGRNGSEYQIALSAAPIKDHAGNAIGVILVLSDVTGQYQAAQQVRESELNLRRSQEIAKIGNWVYDPVSRKSTYSDEMYRLFALDKADITGDPAEAMIRAVHPDDRAMVRRSRELMESEGQRTVTEYRIILPDHSVRTVVATRGDDIPDEAGRMIKVTGIVQDVTERVAADRALRQSEEKLRGILANLSDAVFATDLRGLITYISPSSLALFGHAPEHMIGRPFTEFLPQDQIPVALSRFERALTTGLPTAAFDLMMLRADGSTFHGELNSTISETSGRATGTVGLIRDVTAVRRSEQALRETEARLQGVVANLEDVVYTTDARGRITYLSPAARTVFGCTPERMVGRPFTDFLPDDQIPIAMAKFQRRILVDDTSTNLALVMKRDDGTTFFGELNGGLLREHGEGVSTVGVIRDVSDRRRAAEALQAERALLASIVDTSPVGITQVDADGRITFANERASQILGIPRDEIVKRTFNEPSWEIRSPSGQAVADSDLPFSRVMATGQIIRDVRYTVRRADGSSVLLSISSAPVLDGAGRPVGVVNSLDDITDRQKSEDALRESQARLLESNQIMFAILDHTLVNAVYLDARFDFIWVNRAYADSCRQEPSYFPGKNHFDLYPDAETRSIFQNVVDTGKPFFVAEHPFVFPDQPERGVTYWDWNLIPVKDSIGSVTGLVWTLTEVTEHKRARDALWASRESFDQLFDSSPVPMAVNDREGNISHLNRKFTETFGYTLEDVPTVEKWWSTAYPDPAYRQLLQAQWQHALTEVQNDGRELGLPDMRLTCKDGKVLDVHLGLTQLGDQGIVIMHDVTERRRAEDRVRHLLAEKELLLREVHHRIKNNLNTVVALLGVQASTLANTEAITALRDTERRVRSMVVLYDKLYQSKEYSLVSVGSHIPALVEEIAATHHNRAYVTVRTHADDAELTPKVLFPLGIVINELVANAMKYAFVGRPGGLLEVSLTVAGKRATLVVQDDGPGMPAPLDKLEAPGFGLQMVSMLSEQMGGTLREENRGGARFELTFDL